MSLRRSSDPDWSAKILAECIGEELPPCQAACPLDIRVREKLRFMKTGRMDEALAVVLERCPFPGILGRICAHPCETACTRGSLGGPIAIAGLKRYLADLFPDAVFQVAPGPARPQGVAVVGGGPAGLMAAYELRRLGYWVALFEAENALGGALRRYIPPYRLPREVLDRELAILDKLGVEVFLGTRLGREVHLEELRRDFAAVFLALGAHKSLNLGVAGEHLPEVRAGLDFLSLANSGAPLEVGPRVAVIGGGNAAVDVARTALRTGGRQVTLVCLETLDEMPAFPQKISEAQREGVQILHRWGVKAIVGATRVTGLELKAVTRVFDGQGRFAPAYDDDTVKTLEVDAVLVAIGQRSELGPWAGALASGSRSLRVDPVTLETGLSEVFAGGDMVTGPRTAVEAFAAGRRAALAIDAYLQGQPLPEVLPPLASRGTGLIPDINGAVPEPRTDMDHLPVKARMDKPEAEVEMGFTAEQALAEAERCLSCVCSKCVTNCTFLQNYVRHYPFTEKEMMRLLRERGAEEPLIPYSCHFCGLCQAVCPKDLHAGEACLDFRQRLVDSGKGPLPPHKGIQNYVKWGTSPYFTLTRPDPATGKARWVFFPGCSLPGYSPHLVKAAYAYLREKLTDVGIILNCCGAPSHLTGEAAVFEGVLSRVASDLERLGGPELIAACTHCLHTLKDFRPGLRVRSIYEVMAEKGLPEAGRALEPGVFNIHDACGARGMPQIHDAVRRLVTDMGHGLEEMPHSREATICCGAGGMVEAVNAPLAQKMQDFRLSEANRDLITYCATCRARFRAAGRPAAHLLELLFNPRWRQALDAPPSGSLKRWWNRWRLKSNFSKNFKGKTKRGITRISKDYATMRFKRNSWGEFIASKITRDLNSIQIP
ncbi:MAG: FAD-binding protein [Deltaproteobacteria bacterium]|nr:FAD-binding protein [Deltaproteobacteria bacterium]